MKIAIVKYGMGNVASVQKAIKKLGFESIITADHNEIKKTDLIILPGVGSFCAGMENLHKLDLVNLLTQEVVAKKKPFIGICLGMQLIASYGTEPYRVKGLGWIDGEVVKIESGLNIRIPHLGWNNVKVENQKEFFQEFDGLDYYFIHSYHFNATHKEQVVLSVDYGNQLVAAVHKENIYAMQFHPEKSQEAGMKLLQKIIAQYA